MTRDLEIFKKVFDLQSDIICNAAVASKLMDSPVFDCFGDPDSIALGEELPSNKYIIGTFNGFKVEVDPLMHWNDIRVLDSNGNELLDFSKDGLTPMDLV